MQGEGAEPSRAPCGQGLAPPGQDQPKPWVLAASCEQKEQLWLQVAAAAPTDLQVKVPGYLLANQAFNEEETSTITKQFAWFATFVGLSNSFGKNPTSGPQG